MQNIKNIFDNLFSFWKESNKREKVLYGVFSLVIFLGFLHINFWESPKFFPQESTISIKKGTTLGSAAVDLLQKGYIRSEFWFKVFVTLFGGTRSVVAGDYYFDSKQNIIDIARRIVGGKYGITEFRITIPEGSTNVQIAEILGKQFSLFDPKVFIKNAEEGKMFPDTYFFMSNLTSSSSIERMRINFDEKIESIKEDLASSTRTFDEILIMATLLEEEANNAKDRKKVADILWRRLDIGMALQVDSALETYDRRGLPEKPISNPGLEAILDAIYPTKTKYLYFLSDLKGNMYYAENFEGHQRNRELYYKK